LMEFAELWMLLQDAEADCIVEAGRLSALAYPCSGGP
jgi:hypothetical protein